MNNTTGENGGGVTRLSYVDVMIEGSVMTAIILVGIAGNGLVLSYNITKRRNAISPMEVLILNSTLADFLTSIIIIAQLYGIVKQSWPAPDWTCDVVYMIGAQCISVSICSNFCISILCLYKCVLRPHSIISLKLALSLAIALWPYTFILLSYHIFAGNAKVSFDDKFIYLCWLGEDKFFPTYLKTSLLPAAFLPAFLTMLIYVILFVKIQFFTALSNVGYNEKLARCTLGITVLFFICYLPGFALKLADLEKYSDTGIKAIRYSQYLFYSNIALNPIYYMYRWKSLHPPCLVKFLKRSVNPEAGVGTGTNMTGPGFVAAEAGISGVGTVKCEASVSYLRKESGEEPFNRTRVNSMENEPVVKGVAYLTVKSGAELRQCTTDVTGISAEASLSKCQEEIVRHS